MYRAVSPTKTGNPPLALFANPGLPIAKENHLKTGRFLLLDQIQEPGNAGALIRAAAAFGFQGVLWHEPCVFPFHHGCIRSSAGSLFHLPQFRFDPTLGNLLPKVIGTAARGHAEVDRYHWPANFILAMGNEGHGHSPEVSGLVSARVTIPMETTVESLNVAGAAHILMYRLYRENLGKKGS